MLLFILYILYVPVPVFENFNLDLEHSKKISSLKNLSSR